VLTRERTIALTVSLVFAVSIFIYGLRWLEFFTTFHPVRVGATEEWTPPSGGENVWFKTVDGYRLNGWFFESRTRPSTATVIFFHGNSGNISNVGWLGQWFSERGFDALLVDYRGYGASEGEQGSEWDLYADGDAAFEFVVNEKHVRPQKIILYGTSLGTTVVADVGSRHRVGALIIESGLSSASSLATHRFSWLPRRLHFLGKNGFESARKLGSVKAPVLIVHGDPDPVIPTSEGRILFEAANQPKQLLIFPGAGHNVFGSVGDPYLDQVAEFIRRSTADAR
jgi:pimeloyl-ACP methyl ester carboxylesterase